MSNRMDAVHDLYAAGQSVWLDYIRRGMLTSGELKKMVDAGWVRGVTSNPTIFQKAIAGSNDYDEALARVIEGGQCTAYEAFLELGGEDIRLAADVLLPVHERTQGADGFVSFEAQENPTDAMIAEVNRMSAVVGRRNVMIKVPGTENGVRAVEPLIASGISVNITLLFDVDVYEQVALAYIRGLERRRAAGQRLDTVASVASFFVSRVDTKVDGLLPEGSPLRGKVAVANAWEAYNRFQRIFSGPEWERLAKSGARVQRPLWASTGTKNPAYSDVKYVEELVAPRTVNTMPEATMRAFLDHGQARPSIEERMAEAQTVLRQAAEAGIDLKRVTSEVLSEGLETFGKDFQKLLDEIGKRLEGAHTGGSRWRGAATGLGDRVQRRLDDLQRNDVVRRIWSYDHTVWSAEPTEITQPNRLGWLDVLNIMDEEVPHLEQFASEAAADGFDTVVLLGMGGSSLAPEVMATTFGPKAGRLRLEVLDTTVPDEIAALEERIDPRRTLFIVASKSGTTIETLSHMAYFWEKAPDGRRFIAITDPGTPLETQARERGFRRVFVNPPGLGGRYSALSYFGLVPAALTGVDIGAVVESAHEMMHACHYCLPPLDNPGAWLGAVIGEAALAGRDKLTLVLPKETSSFGDWAEQLIAESTGKQGKGIIPVVGEDLGPPEVYGDDRLFVGIGDYDGLAVLERAGHPVVRLPLDEPRLLGAAFFQWELATAVAGHILGLNPFDQPDVEAAKSVTSRILAGEESSTGEAGNAERLLGEVRAGDYIGIQAYLPRTEEARRRLHSLRMRLRDRYQVATTSGFGPRYLHSTGQVHKGGPDTGVFVQVVGTDERDMPVPGKAYTFGDLKRAQALGDLLALQRRGRRVARTTLDELERAVGAVGGRAAR